MNKIDLEAKDWSLAEMAHMHHMMRIVASLLYNAEKCKDIEASEELAFDTIKKIVKNNIKVPKAVLEIDEVYPS